jgi:hypothetical protein
MPPSASQAPRRHGFTAEEQAAIDRAIAARRLQRIPNGLWRDSLRTSPRAILEALFAVNRDPHRHR